MQLHTTDTVCAITGTHPANLKRWMQHGLISGNSSVSGWSDNQLAEIRSLVTLTGTGATLQEINTGKVLQRPVCTAGWAARKGDLLWQLEYGTQMSLYRKMREMSNNYCGDDLIYQLLSPLSCWLQNDERKGARRRLARFELSVQQQAQVVMRTSSRRGESVPLFLEAVSIKNASEIWLEAIRLTAMGFNVSLSSVVTGTPADKPQRHHHHVLWCGAGINKVMYQYFDDERAAGNAVMLSGPDKNLYRSLNKAAGMILMSGIA
ncbi:transcriptional regulator [Pantoea sp. LMR881]|uniref:transcriptional regulator n=1 Tax=Pantoea sp. LMR881 TaxID=3014336 RepID=UPI0022AFCD06|nr:transcriptional regulator [Pantoea sp. LMR881]MCZ4057946.1 transcriptional regulator [Pantoea sp. LMR881]